jgi:hypothetical protein
VTGEFRGVPDREWRDLYADVRQLSNILFLVTIVLIALLVALTVKGVISVTDLYSWAVPRG